MLDGKHLVTSSITDVLGVKPEVLQTPTAVRIDLADKSDTISYNNPTKESFLGNDIYDEYVTPERVAFIEKQLETIMGQNTRSETVLRRLSTVLLSTINEPAPIKEQLLHNIWGSGNGTTTDELGN